MTELKWTQDSFDMSHTQINDLMDTEIMCRSQ